MPEAHERQSVGDIPAAERVGNVTVGFRRWEATVLEDRQLWLLGGYVNYVGGIC